MKDVTLKMMQAAKWRASTDSFIPVVENHRLSTHNLIGDLWLAGMEAGRFDKKNNTNFLLYLLDDEIPLPTASTALAWMMICESGYSLIDYPKPHRAPIPHIILPQSSTSLNLRVQTQLPDRTVSPDLNIPTMGPSRAYFGPHLIEAIRAREAHHNGFAEVTPTGFQIANSITGKLTAASMWACDEHNGVEPWLAEEVLISRLAIMSKSLIYPMMPTTGESVTGPMGAALAPLTKHGMAVAPGPDSTPAMTWMPDGAEIQLKGPRFDMLMTQVPMMTPFLWFGFTKQESIDRWLAAYMQNRQAAIRQAAEWVAPREIVLPGNPTWPERLLALGAVKTHNKPKTRQTREGVTDSAMEAAMARFTNSFNNNHDSGED